jgi:hypothetical protein
MVHPVIPWNFFVLPIRFSKNKVHGLGKHFPAKMSSPGH